jgi:hypothetical protein
MSDFLTNLVTRSFAQAPSVQPMTLSAYAAPEPLLEPDPVEHVVELVPRVASVQNTDKNKVVIDEALQVAETPTTVMDVPQSPVAAHQNQIENSELPRPALTQKSVVPAVPAVPKPRVMSKPDQTIALPVPTTHREIQVQKTAPEIVEHVVERVVERPTVKTVERRPVVKRIVEEQSTITNIERPSVTSIERSVEHSSITIENTEQVTNSFTTLVPKVMPQPLPLRHPKARSAQPRVDSAVEQETTITPSPETVINVAIGRIEVRATPAATPKRDRPHGPKVMTLDDYQQQRSRGTQ